MDGTASSIFSRLNGLVFTRDLVGPISVLTFRFFDGECCEIINLYTNETKITNIYVTIGVLSLLLLLKFVANLSKSIRCESSNGCVTFMSASSFAGNSTIETCSSASKYTSRPRSGFGN